MGNKTVFREWWHMLDLIRPKTSLIAAVFFTSLVFGVLHSVRAAESVSRPNVVVIVADDLGYVDIGIHGCKDVATPHIDSIANGGARFTQGYVSGCVCSPTRAGLMTGRYQQRRGHDSNPPERKDPGLDLAETTLAQRMKDAGYFTGMVGKWHLGQDKEHFPLSRGFDEFFGLLPHGIGSADAPVYRQWEEVTTPADHTLAFGTEAVKFIDRHHAKPFFLYLPFTAVHSPHIAPERYTEKFAHIADAPRRKYLAMIKLLDDQVGDVLGKLREHKLEENTLVFFFSDNGGPTGRAVSNGALRGGKWTVWEGGIRVPFFVQWKGHIPPGRVLDVPVIQLDVFPTALAAAGVDSKSDWHLDGVNLLPLLEGKTQSLSRDALYWRFGVQFAVRQGDWKLVKPSLKDEPKLINLVVDPGEEKDLSASQLEKVRALTALWEKWNASNIPPRWEDARWNGGEERKEAKEEKKKAKKAKKAE